MNKHEVVEKLIKARNNNQWGMSSAFGGAAGVNGAMNVQQTDMNKAIESWLGADDPKGILEVTQTLRATGGLSDAEYEEIMNAIEEIK